MNKKTKQKKNKYVKSNRPTKNEKIYYELCRQMEQIKLDKNNITL